MVPIALGDELIFAPSARFAFACDEPALAGGNLVERAFERLGMSSAPMSVALRKRIPVGAGLGGGSSDAGAVLRAAAAGVFGEPDVRDWIADARALGSDVPFFLAGAPALVEGTGERVTALGAAPAWWTLLVVPGVHVATGEAYAHLARARDRRPAPSRPRAGSASIRCGEALQRGDFGGVLATMTNDFEPVIRDAYPAVAAALDALAAAGASRAMLSGSGGACFALAQSEADARGVESRLAVAGARTFIVPFAHGETWT